MATLRQLAARLNGLADEVEDIRYDVMARYVMAILRALLPATPVDTSRALSNWRVGTGVAPPIRAHVPGEFGATESASTAIAIAEAENAIKANEGARTLVIFNATPYIRKLNEGSSRQAPAGFIEKAVLAGRLAAKRD